MNPRGPVRKTLVAEARAEGERLDLFLVRSLPGISRKGVKKALDSGQVFVDGQVAVRASHPLQGGETIRITLDASHLVPVAPPPFEVVFRDGDLLAISKPPGIDCHPTGSRRFNALDLIAESLVRDPERDPLILLHRLDVETSGLLLFALNSGANAGLSGQFARREVSKTYLALVAGGPPDVFRVSNHLKAVPRGRTVAAKAGGQPAETAFRTLARSDLISLVEARPLTGRTHQIRVHLSGEGFPILGDKLYGGAHSIRLNGTVVPIERHLLHAIRLEFRHPASGEPVILEAAPPEDFRNVLERAGIPFPMWE